MSRWFRMYDEVLDDPKVQRLTGDDFKAWVNLLCLASRNDGALPPVEDIAFALRLDGKKAAAVVKRLVSYGLLVEEADRFAPNKWNDRQYKSDVSTDRVKRFRERSKTVTETPPDTETEVEKNTGDKSPAPIDPDTAFWDSAKTYLGKSKASLIGQWVRDHGKEATASAIAAAQVERAVDPVAFIQGRWRLTKREAAEMPLC